jgi:Na+-transporting NADH:ubiquinone oxidoreductase subunit A
MLTPVRRTLNNRADFFMHYVTLKTQGYRFHLSGVPTTKVIPLSDPPQVAMLPGVIPHIKPRLNVAEGDAVRIGTLLFHDKRRPDIGFASPAGGRISRIQYGPRRVIQAIVIDRASGTEPHVVSDPLSEAALARLDRGALVEKILKAGLWWVLRQLPFRDIADPTLEPPMILVSLDAKEPFQPAPDIYLQGNGPLLSFGLKVLSRLADGKVAVFTGADNQAVIEQDRGWLTHIVSGRYPSDDPGTVLYRIKTRPAENRAWYITGQDLLLLAGFLSQGRHPVHRTVSVGGSTAPKPRHCRVRIGAPLHQLADPRKVPKDARWIVGGLFRGFPSSPDGFMGLYETALNLVPQGGTAEFLSLFKPGWRKHSYSRIFLSKLNPAPLEYDCRFHGDRRACIACMHCTDVCPVDLMPHIIYKSILVEEVEEYLQLGLLDCVECGLCSYVCPSKIELAQTLTAAKAAYAKEQTQTSE